MSVRIIGTLVALALCAAAVAQPEEPVPALAADAQQVTRDGAALSDAVSAATGMSMSPLLGMSAVGAWRWYRSPAAARAHLPWHQQPWFWGSGIALLALFFLGDKIPVVRHFLKTLKLNQNTVFGVLSAVVTVESLARAGTGAVTQALATLSDLVVPSALAADGVVGALSGVASTAVWAVALVLAVVAVGAVWLLSNAVDVLVLMSPFAPLDVLLRTARLALLLVLVVAVWISPTLGAVVASAIIIASVLVAGWSFRLTVFGSVMAWDFLTFRREGPGPDGSVRAFATNVPKAPRRTWGTVSRTGEVLKFTWRPWLVLPPRSATLPSTGPVGIGLMSPVILAPPDAGGRELVRLPPRYRGAHGEIAAALGASDVVDVPLVKGLRAAITWMRGTAMQAVVAVRSRPRAAG